MPSWLINYPLWVAQYPYVPGTSAEYSNLQTMPTPISGNAAQPAVFNLGLFGNIPRRDNWPALPPSQLCGFQLLQWFA